MMFQQVNRTDAEKVYIVAKNGFATTLTAGYIACFDMVGDTTGVTVSQAQTATNSTVNFPAGVVADNIATGAYGRIQVYGLANVYFSTEASEGGKLGQVYGVKTAGWFASSSGLTTGELAISIVAAQAVSDNSLANFRAFIRCL